jgi:hypothetical protein
MDDVSDLFRTRPKDGDVIEVFSEAVRFGEASFFIPFSEEDVSTEIGQALGSST